jgi:hypothetical protein
MNVITTRDFDKVTDRDINFTYELLRQRYSNPRSLIKFVTPTELPSYDQHKQFIANCLIARIATVNSIDVGFSYVDKKHYLGHFYDFSALKTLYKKYKITGEDISVAIFKDMGSRLPKGTVVFAQISSKNTTALRLADRTMEHISTLYGYEI